MMNFPKVLILLFITGIQFKSLAQLSTNYCVEIELVTAKLKENHFKPVTLNEQVRKEIIQLYINDIDRYNRFFTSEQVEQISSIAEKQDLCSAFKESVGMFVGGVKNYDSLVHAFYKSPVKFLKGEKITTNSVKFSHLRLPKSQLNTYLIKTFKLDYLYYLEDLALQDSMEFNSEKQITAEIDQKARDKMLKTEEVYLLRTHEELTSTQKKLFEHFLNAIAMRFDPHSNYFTLEEYTAFEDELSSETASFGIQLIENDDYQIEVGGITPGSSAWFSGEINEGDIIESVETMDGEVLELSLKGMKNVFKILKNPNYHELNFNVRKKSGELLKVYLSKTQIENTENSFRAYIMKDGDTKLGYIQLPSFYSDAQLGCANDVAKEIILLKKEGINGLVLDLRNNGGGSVKEAVDLCGLFITEGPIVVFEDRVEKPQVIKDMNRGTVYDGPLIVLVNNSSASASEIVSGCLQDYNRALIVGDVSYGKGTAQSVYPVDALGMTWMSTLNGQLKITNGKFYHVSSRSNQSTGIVPDILVKDVYASVDFFKEKFEPFHFENDSTLKKAVYSKLTKPFTSDDIQRSQQRINDLEHTKKLQAYSDSLKILVEEDQEIPLELLPFMQMRKNKEAFSNRLDSLENDQSSDLQVVNHAFVEHIISLNPDEKQMNEETIKLIKDDFIIQQTLLIYKEIYTFEPTKN